MPGSAGDGAPEGGRFEYFMVRIHVDAPGGPSGVVERLGTGRKHGFAGADELLRLLVAGSPSPPKMQDAEAPHNE